MPFDGPPAPDHRALRKLARVFVIIVGGALFAVTMWLVLAVPFFLIG